jgi:outer membrane protein OmpA-like peptidoglycan-associated protein
MIRCFSILLLVTWLANADAYAQSNRYTVKVAPFSSRISDEFSPVFYKGGIVFCSNQGDNALIGYKDEQNGLFKVFFASGTKNNGYEQPKLLSREITTDVNDGPVTFSEDGRIIYYSRNNNTEKLLRNISDTTNKLGIYSAEFVDGIWTNISPFPYNNPGYSFCMPALTPDGQRIYFSSDMPGGSGGMDLYYCDRRNNNWDPPVNLGNVINTSKNESFPYAGKYGKLFFASDGHPGYGGKDIYYTQEINKEWIVPVHLDSAINSAADDFGLISDSTFNQGYFSTNRRGTDDIFSFNAAPVEFSYCDTIKENNYCFTFYDERYQLIDTMQVIYQWDFGDGIKRMGSEVKHCFPGKGRYTVSLSITDQLTGKEIAEKTDYEVELEDIEQAYIHSGNVGLVDQPVTFDGAKSHLEGFSITDYLWNFGDGFKQGQPVMSNTFRKKGEYTVLLGLIGAKDSLGRMQKACVMKKIRIFDNFEEIAFSKDKEMDASYEKADASENKTLQIRIYFMDDISERQKEKIRKELSESGISAIVFDRYGIKPSSYSFLDDVVRVLNDEPEVRLEITLHTTVEGVPVGNATTTEIWAQELAYYFKNRGAPMNASQFKGMGSSYPMLKPIATEGFDDDGIIALIFVKNEK